MEKMEVFGVSLPLNCPLAGVEQHINLLECAVRPLFIFSFYISGLGKGKLKHLSYRFIHLR